MQKVRATAPGGGTTPSRDPADISRRLDVFVEGSLTVQNAVWAVVTDAEIAGLQRDIASALAGNGLPSHQREAFQRAADALAESADGVGKIRAVIASRVKPAN